MKKWLPWIIVAVIIFGLYSWGKNFNNTAVKLNENVSEAWGNVQTAYQRRNDLIGNLVNTVKGAADFERKTLTDVIEARALLDKADSLIRKRRLTEGVELFEEVLELSGGDVPFPGLYEELFENLRQEFETDLLNLSLAIGSRLLEERDFDKAFNLLSKVEEVIPDNEELSDLTGQALDGARGFLV